MGQRFMMGLAESSCCCLGLAAMEDALPAPTWTCPVHGLCKLYEVRYCVRCGATIGYFPVLTGIVQGEQKCGSCLGAMNDVAASQYG